MFQRNVRLRAASVGLAAAVLASIGGASAASASPRSAATTVSSPPSMQLAPAVLRAKPGAVTTSRVTTRPAARALTAAVHSTFVVTYHGFTPAAQTAFQRAVDIWSTQVSSTEPIRVDATWEALDPGVLGQAGPNNFYKNFVGAPRADTWYPVALANALNHSDIDAGHADISADFSSNAAYWYLGTDGNTPIGKYDFTSVVLHELGHGLGFIGSGDMSGTTGSFGYGSGFPFAYDRFTENGAGTAMLSYANPSVALGNQFRSNSVYFDGTQERASRTGLPAKLYDPPTWEPGSSYSHFDENTFIAGDPDSLMTPQIADGESIHDPGPLMLGVFRDMGWTTASLAPSVAAAPTLVAGTSRNAGADLSWAAPGDTGHQAILGYRIRRYFAVGATLDATTDTTGTAVTARSTGMTNGLRYQFTVATINESGVSAESAKSAVMAPFNPAPFATSDAFVRQQFLDFHGRAATAAELTNWKGRLNSGLDTPPSAVIAIAQLTGSADKVEPVTRLFSAYFLRTPDVAGLNYWVGRLRTGATLATVSSSFANSGEFKTRYASLTNRQFILLIYTNVLERSPDTAGVNYWTGKLDAGSTRGAVMISFSESAENKAKSLPKADTVMLYVGLLRRAPTDTELNAAVARLTANPATPRATIAAELLAGTEYDARIP